MVFLYRDVARTYNAIYATVALLFFYCIMGLTMIGATVYKAITTNEITMQWLFEVCEYMVPCYFILCTVSAFYLYFRFYTGIHATPFKRYTMTLSGYVMVLINLAVIGVTLAIFNYQVVNAKYLYYENPYNHHIEEE